MKYYECIQLRDLRELIDHAADTFGDQVIIREFNARRQIVDHTCRQLQADVKSLGAILVADGLKGKHVALIGESSYQYVVCYLAIVNWVGVIVPIDRELSEDEIVTQLRLCDAAALIYSDSLARKMSAVLSQCPDIQLTVRMGEQHEETGPVTVDSLIATGRELLEKGTFIDFEPEIDICKACTIIFTSGTTGANKGVMLCHQNITTVIHSALSMFKPEGTYFSVLPINHTVEMNLFILGNICAGNPICFNDTLKNVKENMALFKPDMSMMVPMIVEHLYKNIWKEAEKAKQKTTLQLGILASNGLRLFGIDKRDTLFAPILDGLGGNLKLIFCGGAPLNPELVKGFANMGINIYNGYGITECSPLVSSNCPLSQVPGSVGLIAPDCQVRIDMPGADGAGEIQVKGNNVMLGYYKDEESTRRSFTEDGWFKTGDIGRLDKANNVYITGRAKNLIISSNGKNVYPEELEECLMNQIPYLKEVVVFAPKDKKGNDRIISASAYLDPQFMSEVGGLEKARDIFKEDVNKVNRHLAKFKRISQVMIRETEFEKTTTKKIKRHNQTI